MGNGGFIWHEGDYLRDTSHLTDMEDLAYRRLLGAYHSRGGPLPKDQEKLCRIAKLELKHVLPVVEEFFTVGDDGMLHQRGADRRIQERQAFISEQTRKAKLGAEARWKHARGHDSDARGNGGAMPGACPPSPSPSPSPSQKEKESTLPRASRGNQPQKVAYAPRVFLTKTEHAALIEKHGSEATTWMIDRLDAWKESKGLNGKGRGSDAGKIRVWVVDAWEKYQRENPATTKLTDPDMNEFLKGVMR